MIELSRYKVSHQNSWDKLVAKSNNGTIFHLRSFLNYHPKARFKDHSLIAMKNGKLFSVFPASEKVIIGRKYLVSHPGASMGSFVVPENLSIADSIALVESLIKYSKNNKIDGIRITLPPNLYQVKPSNYMDYAFFRNKFRYLKREVTSILFLEDNLKKTLDKFRPSHRRSINKALSVGVKVVQTEDFITFYEILKNNLKIRHGVEPTHTIQELESIKSLFPNKCNLFGAYVNGKMIAGVVNFIINNHVVLAFYIGHNEKFSEYRSVNLLFYTIFEWAIKEGYSIYDFGIFTVNGEPNMGLGRFKENFGASGIYRDTIALEL